MSLRSSSAVFESLDEAVTTRCEPPFCRGVHETNTLALPFSPYRRQPVFWALRIQTATKEGTGTLTMSGSNMNLSYTVGSVTQTKPSLERFNISASVPACTLQNASRTAATNYTDLWWGGATAAGWGLQITHRGDQVFAGWYAHGDNCAATWITAQGAQYATNPKRFTGQLYQIPIGTAFSQRLPYCYLL